MEAAVCQLVSRRECLNCRLAQAFAFIQILNGFDKTEVWAFIYKTHQCLLKETRMALLPLAFFYKPDVPEQRKMLDLNW